jgi:hypothetical protein
MRFRFTVNFAQIFIPRDPKVPRRMFIHKFQKRAGVTNQLR